MVMLVILIPSKVLMIVGPEEKGKSLGLVLVIGGIVSLLVPPLAGAVSDSTTSAVYTPGGVSLKDRAVSSSGWLSPARTSGTAVSLQHSERHRRRKVGGTLSK